MNKYRVEIGYFDYEKQDWVVVRADVKAPSAADAWFIVEKDCLACEYVSRDARPFRIKALKGVATA